MGLHRHNYSFQAMGGVNTISLYCQEDIHAPALLKKIQLCIEDLEQKYSRYRDCSIISHINSASGAVRIKIDEETRLLLAYADSCYKESNGLFDITSGVLRTIWDFHAQRVPSDAERVSVLKRIGWKKVSLTDEGILLQKEGMQIDLGGIVKEYAADKAAAILKDASILHGLVNFAGDIHCIGPHPDGTPWTIGITHPRNTGETITSIGLSAGALATSGDYERYFEQNGTRYCHIMNPKTGWPVTELQSVTVCADACLVAGSLSTMAMLLGKKRGLKLLTDSRLHYFVVDSAGEVHSPRHESCLQGS